MFDRTLDAVLVHLTAKYTHQPDDGTTNTVGRLVRNTRFGPDVDPVVQTMVRDASYSVTNEGDPRTLIDIIKEVADYKQGKQFALRGMVDRSLVDSIVAILKLPCPANLLTVPSIHLLQESLLRPDETTQAKMVEVTKTSRCFRCGHLFRDGDAVVYHSPDWSGDSGSVMVCAACEIPQSAKCGHAECSVRVPLHNNPLSRSVLFCPEHSGVEKPKAKPAPTTEPGILNYARLAEMQQELLNQQMRVAAVPPRARPIFRAADVGQWNAVPTPAAPEPVPVEPFEDLLDEPNGWIEEDDPIEDGDE